MRHFWVAVCAAGLVVIAGSGGGRSQAPLGAPAAPAAGGAVAAPAPAAVAGAAAEKVGFFKRICIGLDECRRRLCKTPAGQLLNNMTMPISGFTGGVIPPFCPLMPSAKDLAQPGAAGAAAAAQKEALEAGARRDAVRFLGTLDCRYFPDAAPALAAALRGDSSECVRYEAALVLNRGCCCTEITIKALEASVAGVDGIDNFPAERSVRVRCAAALALERCLACYVPPPADVPVIDGGGEKPPEKPGELPAGMTPAKPGDTLPPPTPKQDDPNKPTTAKPDAAKPGAKAAVPHRLPSPETVERARRTLNEFNAQLAAAAPAMAARPGIPTAGRQSLYHLLKDTAELPPLIYPTAPTMASAPAPAPAPAMSPTPITMPTAMASPPLNGPGATLSRPIIFTPMEPTLAPEPVRAPTPTLGPKPMSLAEPARIPAPVVAPKPMPAAPAAPTAPPVSAAPPRPEPSFSPAPSSGTAPRLVPASLAAPASNDKVYEWGKQVLQSPNAADRHNAIRQLVQYDWKQHPMVASVLLAGAKSDPNNVVRVDCLRHLAAYKIDHPQVLTDLAVMVGDSDPWVRQEAAQALSQIKQAP